MNDHDKAGNSDQEDMMQIEDDPNKISNEKKAFIGRLEEINENQKSTNAQSSFANEPNKKDKKIDDNKKNEIIKTGQGTIPIKFPNNNQNESPKEPEPEIQKDLKNSISQIAEGIEKIKLEDNNEEEEEEKKEINKENQTNGNQSIPFGAPNPPRYIEEMNYLQPFEQIKRDESISNDEIFDLDNFVMPESNHNRPPLDGNIFDYDIETNEPTINYEDQEEEEVYNDTNFSTEDNRG